MYQDCLQFIDPLGFEPSFRRVDWCTTTEMELFLLVRRITMEVDQYLTPGPREDRFGLGSMFVCVQLAGSITQPIATNVPPILCENNDWCGTLQWDTYQSSFSDGPYSIIDELLVKG